MKPKIILITILILAIFFSIIFYNQSIGLNYLLFELISLSVILGFNKVNWSNTFHKLTLISFVISLLGFIIHFTTFAFVIHILSFLLLVGCLSNTQVNNIVEAFLSSAYSILNTPIKFLSQLNDSDESNKFGLKRVWNFKFYIIPIVIVLIFIGIYRNSNPYFNNLINYIERHTIDLIPNLTEYLNAQFIFLFILGFIINSILLLNTSSDSIIKYFESMHENIIRIRSTSFNNKPNILRIENKTGVLLLIFLNLIILILNSIDIYWVWFNFKWDGEYLKQFVHEGTYLLILSILFSIAIVLYYFRGNQNFYQKNNLLKKLTYIWIIQNVILCISVGIRNYWYIDYFNLAYKRIGVIIFLMLTLYGLYTVFIKVQQRKSALYLMKRNGYALIIVLMLSSIVNWDKWIVRYNFNHSNSAFIHFDFLSSMSDKVLPELDKTLDELKIIEAKQKELFQFTNSYMKADEYFETIQKRKERFISNYSTRKLLSWNYADYKTYQKLTANNK